MRKRILTYDRGGGQRRIVFGCQRGTITVGRRALRLLGQHDALCFLEDAKGQRYVIGTIGYFALLGRWPDGPALTRDESAALWPDPVTKAGD